MATVDRVQVFGFADMEHRLLGSFTSPDPILAMQLLTNRCTPPPSPVLRNWPPSTLLMMEQTCKVPCSTPQPIAPGCLVVCSCNHHSFDS